MKQYVIAVLALAGAPTVASAQLACVANITPIIFDTITAASAGTYDARGMISVTCTGSQGANIAACIDLGQGSAANASGQSLLAGPKTSSSLPDKTLPGHDHDEALGQRRAAAFWQRPDDRNGLCSPLRAARDHRARDVYGPVSRHLALWSGYRRFCELQHVGERCDFAGKTSSHCHTPQTLAL